MSTWHTVMVEGIAATEITDASLPDASRVWGLSDGEGWQTPLVYVEGTIGRMVADEDSLYVNGQTKYSVEEIAQWALAFTAEHDGITVTHGEEWDDEGPGGSSTVYRKGELVREESQVSAFVPMDYRQYIDEAKAALEAWEQAEQGNSNDAEHDAGAELATQLRRLIEGIA